jgi:hypothetical protein
VLPARAVASAVVLALAAGACSAGAGETTASSPPISTVPPSADASPGGDSAPVPEVLDFTAQRLGGGTIEGAQYAGSPLAIWFWAPW